MSINMLEHMDFTFAPAFCMSGGHSASQRYSLRLRRRYPPHCMIYADDPGRVVVTKKIDFTGVIRRWPARSDAQKRRPKRPPSL